MQTHDKNLWGDALHESRMQRKLWALQVTYMWLCVCSGRWGLGKGRAVNVPPKSGLDRAEDHTRDTGKEARRLPSSEARGFPSESPLEDCLGLHVFCLSPLSALVLLATWRSNAARLQGPLSRGGPRGERVQWPVPSWWPDPSWLLSFLPQACLCPTDPSVFPKCPCPPSLKGPSWDSFFFQRHFPLPFLNFLLSTRG